MTQAAIMTSSSITAYMSRVEVELAHDGHAEQHSEHAALPQQHASYSVKQHGLQVNTVKVLCFEIKHIKHHYITVI